MLIKTCDFSNEDIEYYGSGNGNFPLQNNI